MSTQFHYDADVKKSKRRNLIKNITIVFLAVLLVLTLFSQTIMNHSLPQVSGEYAYSGTITTQVRGTGKVQADQTYNVQLSEDRRVEEIHVEVGDYVEKGAVLFTLNEVENTKLAEERAKLETMEYELELKKLQQQLEDGDESTAAQKVEELEEEIDELEDDLMRLGLADEMLANPKDHIAALDDTIAQLTASKELMESQLPTEGEGETTATTVLEAQNNIISTATAFSYALVDFSYKNPSIASQTYDLSYDPTKSIFIDGDKKKTTQDDESGKPVEKVWNGCVAYYDALVKEYNAYAAGTASKLDASHIADVRALMEKYSAYEEAVLQMGILNGNTSSSAAQQQEADSMKNYIAILDQRIKEAEATKEDLNEAIKIQDDLKAKRKELEAAKKALAKENEDGYIQGQISDLEMEKAEKAVEDQRALVAELEKEPASPEITANVAGTVTNLSVVRGQNVSAGATLAVIELSDLGYTLTFSVTPQQASQIKKGDAAEVLDYWWGEIAISVEEIKADPANPSQSRLVVCRVMGDVSEGEELTVAVGQRSSNYGVTIPKSALRQDSNGSFVLVVESKSSPLGNRHYATRYDVTEITSDDTRVAVTGLSGGEYVIATVSDGDYISAGDQVRLAE